MYPPNKIARRTLTFGITELGFDSSSLFNPTQVLDEITADNNIVVTSTRWSRDRLIDFGFREDKVRVVSCGVDLATFCPLSVEEMAAQRKALQIPTDAVVFLNVGVPTWNKGIDLLLRTFAQVHRRFPNARLILKDARGLYGFPVDHVLKEVERDYPGLMTAATLAAISVIPNNLSQTQLRALYGVADWYVSPYRAEGFNLPVLEAQACGTPVITSSGGATDDFCSTSAVRKIASVFKRGVLSGSRESCWVEPDFHALETLMLQAASEGPLPAKGLSILRQSANENAKLYSWDRIAGNLIELINS
jgi:glycosyltransferase involved in cell wall biosynthesis